MSEKIHRTQRSILQYFVIVFTVCFVLVRRDEEFLVSRFSGFFGAIVMKIQNFIQRNIRKCAIVCFQTEMDRIFKLLLISNRAGDAGKKLFSKLKFSKI